MDTTEVIQQKRFTVVYERKVNLGDYESETAMVSVQGDVLDDEQATRDAIDAAFDVAAGRVHAKLGLDRPAADPIVEVQRAFPGAEVITTAVEKAPAPKATASSSSGEPTCKKCGSEMYDNRASKKNPAQPDYRCKQWRQPPKGTGCDGVIWPPRGGK